MKNLFTQFAVIFTILCILYIEDSQTFEKGNETSSECNDPVTIKQGMLKGLPLVADSGRTFCSFRAVPFALPPVGQYRFQPPQPPKPWKGVLDATTESPDCIQLALLGTAILGQEDCLYLNIYTPKLKPDDGKLFDVIVWIFGGLFYTGSNNLEAIGPHYFMDMDVVLVVINHRLGAFGFLSTDDDESPGNYGMKDQVAALKWVQENISAFGGNSSSVTLVGLSSGAASVHYHILSPMSVGLFHRAISFEGTAINPWARLPNPQALAKKQAKIVGCPTEPTSCLVACLKEMDAVELTNSIINLFAWLVLPTSGYAPVVEKKTTRNSNPFITDDPLALLRNGSFQHVPWILGGTSHGSAIFLLPTLKMQRMQNYLNKYIDELMPKLLMMDYSVPQDQVQNITKRVITHYIGKRLQLHEENTEKAIMFFSDRMLIHPVHKTTQLHVLAGHTNIFKYNFAYTGLYSLAQATTLGTYGTSHGDEMIYLFKKYDGMMPFPSNDWEVRKIFLTMIQTFAKYGHPTPANVSMNSLLSEVNWLSAVDETPEYELLHLRYLNIGQLVTNPQEQGLINLGLGPVKLNMAEDLYKTRMDYWDSLPLYENCVPHCS